MNAMGHAGVTYIARAPLRSYFHDTQKNEIHLLYLHLFFFKSINESQLKTKELKIIMDFRSFTDAVCSLRRNSRHVVARQ